MTTFEPGDRVRRGPIATVGTVRSSERLRFGYTGERVIAVLVDWDDGNVSNLPSYELRRLSALEILAEAAE